MQIKASTNKPLNEEAQKVRKQFARFNLLNYFSKQHTNKLYSWLFQNSQDEVSEVCLVVL